MFFFFGGGGVLLLFFHGSQSKSFRAARMLNLGRNRKRSGEGAWGEGNGFSYFPNHNRTDTLKTKKKLPGTQAGLNSVQKIFSVKSPCAVHVAFCGIFHVQVYSSFCSSVDSNLSV